MALLKAAKNGDSAEVARLLQGGEDVFQKDTGGDTCLHWASAKGHLDVARMLVEKGGEGLLMAKANDGRTCLHYASSNGRLDIARMLVEKGGEGLLMAKNNNGWTCLHCASSNGHLDIARMLVEKGRESLLMAKNVSGYTCLFYACGWGHVEIAKMLVQEGGESLVMAMSPDPSTDGWTCLHYASSLGQLNVVRMLVEEDGEGLFMMQAKDGKTALDIAREKEKTNVANVLQVAMARPWEFGYSLPTPEGAKIIVPGKVIRQITGTGQDAVASFSAHRCGEAKEREFKTLKCQASRLKEARSTIAKLSRVSSANLLSESRVLVTGCIFDAEGNLALDLLALGREEGGLTEALLQHLPLLMGRHLASELHKAVPVALERLQASADAAAEKVAKNSQALKRAEETKEKRQEDSKVHRRRAEISSELLDCTAVLCSCFEDQQSRGGMLRSLQNSQEETKWIRGVLKPSISRAVRLQEAAEKDKAASDQRVRDCSTRLDTISSGIPPLSSEEKKASDEALRCLKQAAQAAAEHLERMQKLVQALQTSESLCAQVLEVEEQAAQSAAAFAAHAQELHGKRIQEQKDAQLVLDQQKPIEERFSAILNQAQINVNEAKSHQVFMDDCLEHAQEGWLALQSVLDGHLSEREAEHSSRLRSGDLASLEEDDLRTLLAGRGLGCVFDQIKASLAPMPFDGTLLASVMKRRKPFAEKLEEVFEATMGVKDVCDRKRAVHVIELAKLGLDIDRYSEGGATGTSCCWSEEQVREELRGRDVIITETQLAGVNGEVLLLLRDMHLEQLGADNAGLKLSIMDAVDHFSEGDLVGRIRLGLEEPPAPGLAAVDAQETERVRQALEKAARDDGDPCLVPLGLVSTWTDDFAESRLVGTGAFGMVYEGIVSSTSKGGKGRVVAVKLLSPETLTGVEKHMQREINVLHQFKHPNIIRLLGYTAARAGGCIIYEMGSRGSLAHNLLDKALAEALTWKHRVRVAHGLSRALNYLHCNDPSSPALHRDVKSANVVLCADFTPKLIDCGLARYSGKGPRPAGTVGMTTLGAVLGTPGYMCPRYVGGGIEFDVKCEVFSVGVVLLELITGKVQGTDGASNLWYQHVEDEEEVVPDPRAGAWLEACLEEVKGLAFECLAKYGKRIASMMAVLRRLRDTEEAHCRHTEEEARQARELVRLQGEKDAGRAEGVFAEKLRGQLEWQESELSRLREETLRLAAARVEEQKKAEQEMRECCVCFDRLRCAEGISCEAGLHFHCNGCFSDEVAEQSAPENLASFKAAEMRLRCRVCLPKKAYFDDGSVPAHLNGESFTAYLRARENVQVGKAMQEQDERHTKHVEELRLQLEAALQQANNHKAAVVLRHRMHVVDNILTLKCPRGTCRAAFIDFDGCFALTCSRCGCGFCAYCLEDCGRDAHAHVANCTHNMAGGGVHAPIDAFHRAQKARITRLVREYVAGKGEEDVRADLVGSMDRNLKDLGISGRDVFG